MALEDLVGPDKFIEALVISNPTDLDAVNQGDDHIRGVKNTLVNSFGAMTGLMTFPAATPINLPAVLVGVVGGAVTLFDDGLERIRTSAGGADVVGPAAVTLGLRDSGSLRGSLSVDAVGNTIVRGEVVGGDLDLRTEGAASNLIGMRLEADGGPVSFFGGVEKARVDTAGVDVTGRVRSTLGLTTLADENLITEAGGTVDVGDDALTGVRLVADDDKAVVETTAGDEVILHTGNFEARIVDTLFPVGSIYITVGNNVPTFSGQTWARIAEGRYLASEGAGTDGGAGGRTIPAGAEGVGRYQVALNESELALHGHPFRVNAAVQSGMNTDATGAFSIGTGGTPAIANHTFTGVPTNALGEQIGGTGAGDAHENSPPGFGLFIWQRTA